MSGYRHIYKQQMPGPASLRTHSALPGRWEWVCEIRQWADYWNSWKFPVGDENHVPTTFFSQISEIIFF